MGKHSILTPLVGNSHDLSEVERNFPGFKYSMSHKIQEKLLIS